MRKRVSFILVGLCLVLIGALVISKMSANRKTESVACGNQMTSIGFAARLWAGDHDGIVPADLGSLSNELGTPKALVCPGEHSRRLAAGWNAFTPENSSYEIVTAGLKEADTNRVFLRCNFHGHLGYADGTVFDGVSRRTKTH